MSQKTGSEFANAADLLAPAEGQTEVYLKTLKKKVTIKKINIGELAAIYKMAKEDEVTQYILLAFKGLVKPKLTMDQARKLPLKVTMELASEIGKFSELDKESMDEVRNLLEGKS